MKHTQEPWHIGNPTPLRPHATVYAKPFGLGDVAEFYEEADAERAVDCVNACVGIEDPAAELARLRRVEGAARDVVAWPARVKSPAFAALRSALEG